MGERGQLVALPLVHALAPRLGLLGDGPSGVHRLGQLAHGPLGTGVVGRVPCDLRALVDGDCHRAVDEVVGERLIESRQRSREGRFAHSSASCLRPTKVTASTLGGSAFCAAGCGGSPS